VTKAQPEGVAEAPFNAVAVAVAMHAGFVARRFVGMEQHLIDVLIQAIDNKGFSLIDVLQPCISFNRVNTFKWYKDRCKPFPSSYDPNDWEAATRMAEQWGEEIPIGIIYRNDKLSFEKYFSALSKGPLVEQELDLSKLKKVMETYG